MDRKKILQKVDDERFGGWRVVEVKGRKQDQFEVLGEEFEEPEGGR